MKLRLAAPVALGLAVLAPASPAHAEPKDACIAAYEQTQTLRKDAKLAEAKAQAAVCARESCPALLAKDCAKWLVELDAIMPSIVLEAHTAGGADRVDVKVKVDGAPLVDRIDGKSVPIDPGAHTLRFEPEGGAPFDKSIVVHEGEKHRRVKVTIPDAPADAAPDGAGVRPVPLGVWIFGGASVVALATSTVFAIDGFSKKHDLEACKPSCAASDVDAMSARFTVADVALGAGVVAGAAALWLYLTRPEAKPERAEPRPFASPTTSGFTIGAIGRF